MVEATNITSLGVFIEGLLSFFSPCILPLVPLYMAYLSSGAKRIDEDGEVQYDTSKVILSTIMFVLGISCTFFILGLSISWLKDYIADYQNIIGIIGGTIVIIFSLGQIGLYEINFKSFHLPINLNLEKFSFLKAFFMGFVFSFAWTPCVGPILTNVLLLAMSQDVVMGNLFIFLYALGLIIPFLFLGLFTKWGLNFLKNNKHIFKYALKIAGVIMLCFGVYMIYDNSNAIVIALNNTEEVSENEYLYLNDISLEDQDGNIHSLSEHEGEYVILNFVATWCKYCKEEIPHFDEFVNANDINAYYVMSPEVNSGDRQEIIDFYKEQNMQTDVLIDESSYLFRNLGISSFPTLVVIGPDGSYIGYVSGALQDSQFMEVLNSAISMYESR